MSTDLEERLARYVAGDRNALDDGFDYLEKTQQPIVMNRGERQVRAEIEKVRPTLDPVTQKLWDNWFDRKLAEAIKPFVKHIGDRVGSLHRELVKDIDENLGAAEKQNEKSIAAHNDLLQGVEIIRESIGKIRDSVKADVTEAVRRLDRNFVTEVAELRAKTLVNFSADLSVVKDDVIAVVRAGLADEIVKIREAAIEATRKEMNATVKSLVDALVLKDRRSLVEETRASLKDELLGEVRGELASEFVQMREAARSELRTELLAELRTELARKLKALRSINRKT